MRAFLTISVAIAALFAAPAVAQDAPMVRSEKPDDISVTVYRQPGRTSGAVNLRWLQGFALITETRTISLPAGPATIRFEGVAEGTVAVSAVVTGLPGGVVQKNRDADLLSPASLLDGTLGNRVTVRRTNPETGNITETEAVIRSGSGGAVVLQTEQGFEALRCSGLPETLVYSEVPDGLVPVPVLSVDTLSDVAQDVTVTLTYLATGFDWGANYVAEVDADGEMLNLFAWLTVANSNPESFPDASMQAVAGTLNRKQDYRQLVGDSPTRWLHMDCWPVGSGRDGISRKAGYNDDVIVVTGHRVSEMSMAVAPPPPPPPAPPPPPVAQQEELGDLKLYRVPMPVTVAANAQKQVALLNRDGVRFEKLIRVIAPVAIDFTNTPANIIRLQNEARAGLGVPLPSGDVAIYQDVAGQRLLAGMGRMSDRAVGEEVDITIGRATGVTVQSKANGEDWQITISNANSEVRTVEVALQNYGSDDDISRVSPRTVRKDGMQTWVVDVPANGTRELTYRYRPPKR